MAYEIEYKLAGCDPHVYRLPRRCATCEEALAVLNKFEALLQPSDKGPGMELKLIWVE